MAYDHCQTHIGSDSLPLPRAPRNCHANLKYSRGTATHCHSTAPYCHSFDGYEGGSLAVTGFGDAGHRTSEPIASTHRTTRATTDGHVSAEIASGVTMDAKPVTAVTSDDLEALRAARLAASRAACANTKRQNSKHGEVGANRLLSRLRHLFVWAIKRRHVTETPFRLGHRDQSLR